MSAVKSLKSKDPISFTKDFAQTFYWYKLLSVRLNQDDCEKSVIGNDSYSKSNMFYTNRLTLNLYCLNPLIYICFSSILFICTIILHSNDFLLTSFVVVIILTSSYLSFLLVNENYNYLGFCFYPLLIYLFQVNEAYLLYSIFLVFIGITPMIFIYLYYSVFLVLNLDFSNIYFVLLSLMIIVYYIMKFGKDIFTIALSTLKVIGAANSNKSIFKRKIIFRKSAFIISIIEFIYLFNISYDVYFYFLIIILSLYILNEFNIFRIADAKSYINLFLIFNTLAFFKDDINVLVYVISLNPIVFLLPLPKRPKSFPEINVITREDIESDIKIIVGYLPLESRVWFAFKKPSDYYNIFSNMRDFLTCLNFNLIRKNSKCMPDLHLLKSDPNIFVTDYNDLISISKRYKFDYVLFLLDEFSFQYDKSFKINNYDFGDITNLSKEIGLIKF